MACTDMLSVLGDEMLPHLDVGGMDRPASSLLAQLLLKVTHKSLRRYISATLWHCSALVFAR